MLSDVCLTSVCLTSVAYIRSAGVVCGRPAGWRVLADVARLCRPGSRLPLRASVAGLGGGISWRPPAYSLLLYKIVTPGTLKNIKEKRLKTKYENKYTGHRMNTTG